MDKIAQQIIDGTAPKKRDYRKPIRPAPPLAETKRRPDKHMEWHLRHRPYGG